MGGHDLYPAAGDVYASAGHGATALVVEDDVRSRIALTALLERGRLTVVAADSGQAALDTLRKRDDVGVVLMDIMMPLMDGYETIRAIRALDAFKALPIIAVTGKVVPGEHQRCIEAGANDYVPKPIDTVELLTVIRPYLPVTTPTNP
jgi:CheY-like chemotaxis protein